MTSGEEIRLDEIQAQAVELACADGGGVCVITGGPGTGKTTTTRTILDAWDGRGVAYELCSPTGKAAKRMQEATGRRARTIHRLLEYNPMGGFGRCAERPLEAQAVVVDEASMVDVVLFAALLEALPRGCRLVMVGDADQLPSVGPGQVLADLVEAEEVPTVRLRTVHRAAMESWVCRNAPQVIAGEMPELGAAPDFQFLECEDAAGVQKAVQSLAMAGGDFQLLTPQKTGPAGTRALNALLQDALNPARVGERSWELGEEGAEVRPRDRVMQTVNNYSLEVFNGEVGVIDSFEEASMAVDYGDRVVRYSRETAAGTRLAYAMTVHKSQGSEFGHAAVVCHSSHTYMLTRQLLYTGITRAKQRVTLIGDVKGIKAALGKGDAPRNSALIERLRGAA